MLTHVVSFRLGINLKSASTTSTLTPTESNYTAIASISSASLPPGSNAAPVVVTASVLEDPFGSAPFSLPPGLKEKAASLRKTGGKS